MTPEDYDSPDRAPEEYTETVVEYVDNRRTRVALVALLVVLFLLLIGVGYFVYTLARPVNPPKAEDIPEGVEWVRSIYAWGDTPEEMLYGPVDVAIGPDGSIWTTTNKRVIVGFDAQGGLIRTIQRGLGNGPDQFTSLEGLDVDEDGNIWVCDYGKGAVMVFSRSGELVREFGVEQPVEIAVRDGKVAIAAASGVAITDTEGTLITKWGARGSGDGDFDLPHGIAITEDGTVLVSDTQNRRIKAYSQEGRLLWARQAETAGEGMQSRSAAETVDGVRQSMSIPAGMTLDGAGRVLLVDPFEFQILVIDAELEGQIVERYGEYGPEDGRFSYPTGIDYDPERDTFAVADTANNRIQVIRLPGSGGNLARRAVAAVVDRPVWLCFLPLVLLVVAMLVAISRRRRAKEAVVTENTGTTGRQM